MFYVFLRPDASRCSRVLTGVLLGVFCFLSGCTFLERGGTGMAGLTDTEIKRAKAAEKAYSMGDGGGLYLWVKPTGGKLWRWSYRFEGKEKLMSLGKYPDVSLALARARHAEARKLLATGIDPMAQRKAEKTAEKAAVENSFQSVAAQWLEHWQEGKSPRHVEYIKRIRQRNPPCWRLRDHAEVDRKSTRLNSSHLGISYAVFCL